MLHSSYTYCASNTQVGHAVGGSASTSHAWKAMHMGRHAGWHVILGIIRLLPVLLRIIRIVTFCYVLSVLRRPAMGDVMQGGDVTQSKADYSMTTQ
jgi:hypothetical protein